MTDELERIRIERQENDTNGEWGEYDPFMYPHKESLLLTHLMKHPKIIGKYVSFLWILKYLVYKLGYTSNHQIN